MQEHGLVGHSNVGMCGVDTAGDMGAIEQMWLNEGGVAAIVSLKVLEKIWLVTCLEVISSTQNLNSWFACANFFYIFEQKLTII